MIKQIRENVWTTLHGNPWPGHGFENSQKTMMNLLVPCWT